MVEYILSYLTIYLKREIILQSMAKEGQSWQVYIPETATCSTCNTYYEKKKGKDFAYKKLEKGGYVCTLDGKVINAETVAHPIWDGPFPMSGSGRCQYESVPYCLRHEEKPNYNGEPIKIKFEDSELYKKIAERL